MTEKTFIRLMQDISDNVFDRTYIEKAPLVTAFGNTFDEDEYMPSEDIYELTEEGVELMERWYDDASCGYDLCNGRAKGLANSIGGTESNLWDYITSDTYCAKKV